MAAESATPTAKVRCFSRRNRTMGSLLRSSQTTKAVRQTTATTASVTIKCDPNQSSSWPLSNMICRAAMPVTSIPKPQ